jgi:hypothetical protein
MFIVFYFLVFLFIVLLWFLLAFSFKPIGRFFYRLWHDVKKATEEREDTVNINENHNIKGDSDK